MPAPPEISDALESMLGIYFSGIRHRERAAFILTDELVEMACKLRAREHTHNFNMSSNFYQSWNAPGVQIPAVNLGNSIQHSRDIRNNMQHANAAATVDDEHCADAILDAVAVLDHCWPGTSTNIRPWMICALRIVRLFSSQGNQGLKAQFEDGMRSGAWRAVTRPPRVSELLIEPGRRQHWTLVMIQSQVQVETILNNLGIP